MQNNSSNPDQPASPAGNPDSSSRSFQEGLTALGNGQYARSWKAFRKALKEYEKSRPATDPVRYYLLMVFSNFAGGLVQLSQKGHLTYAGRFFGSARVFCDRLPQELREPLAPTVDFFSKIFPLDERLRGLFAHPQSFEHLAEGLDRLLEPLSNLLVDSYLTETMPQVRVLVTARANLCMALLYLLGRLPVETLQGLIRDKEPAEIPSEPAILVQWIVNQEERALLEVGLGRLHELIPVVGHFAREMTRLGAPEALAEIPQLAQQRLLSLLAPLRELDLAAGTILEPVLKRFFKEHPMSFTTTPPTEKKIYQPTIQFPVPAGHQWLDLLLVIYREALRIEVVLGKVKRRFSFRELGLIHARTGQLNSLGKALLILAENQGVVSWRVIGADKSLKLRIHRLARLLKSVFPGLAGSPFYPYQQYKAYKIRFKIEIAAGEEEGYLEDTDTSINSDLPGDESSENP